MVEAVAVAVEEDGVEEVVGSEEEEVVVVDEVEEAVEVEVEVA